MSKRFKKTRELVVFALLGSFMFISKLLMEGLPNVHLLGMLTISYTVVYRVKALIPIYVYIFLNGLYAGFNLWWVPYLYIWAVLWALTMLIPKKLSYKAGAIVYPLLCGLHGLAFGTLYAPAQAIMYGLSFENTIRWIIAGLPWDLIHAGGNLAAGLLIVPTVKILRKLEASSHKQ